MNDFKLKLILSGLGGVIFSFIFILLTFVLPVKDKKDADKMFTDNFRQPKKVVRKKTVKKKREKKEEK